MNICTATETIFSNISALPPFNTKSRNLISLSWLLHITRGTANNSVLLLSTLSFSFENYVYFIDNDNHTTVY